MDQKITFANSKGDKLVGILDGPKGKKGPIIIMCHGFSSNKNTNSLTQLNKILLKNNIFTFRFDFFGHGESEGDFANITISEGVDDILQAIKFIKSSGYPKIGLLGSSFGGICSIMAASKTKNLSFLALKSPVSDYEEVKRNNNTSQELIDWKINGYTYYPKSDGTKLKLNYGFYEDFKNNNGYEALKKIKIPSLIIHGNKDMDVPVKQSTTAVKLLKNGKLEVIQNADHRYTDPKHFRQMLKSLSGFIISQSNL